MNNNSQMKIQQLWADEQCPEINGIIYGNGIVKKINIVRDSLWRLIEIKPEFENQTTVTEFLHDKPDEITNVYQLCDKSVIDHNIRLIGGEADWGDFGFIAVENLQTKELKFLMFFDNSNPFVEIDFLDSNILATSNLGEKWIVPIEEPEKMTISLP